MWLPNHITDEVEKVARIHYVDQSATRLWNDNRRDGELRLLTGWCWIARDGSAHRQGFKTQTVAYRDAWYQLVQHADAPGVERPRARVRVVRAA